MISLSSSGSEPTFVGVVFQSVNLRRPRPAARLLSLRVQGRAGGCPTLSCEQQQLQRPRAEPRCHGPLTMSHGIK